MATALGEHVFAVILGLSITIASVQAADPLKLGAIYSLRESKNTVPAYFAIYVALTHLVWVVESCQSSMPREAAQPLSAVRCRIWFVGLPGSAPLRCDPTPSPSVPPHAKDQEGAEDDRAADGGNPPHRFHTALPVQTDDDRTNVRAPRPFHTDSRRSLHVCVVAHPVGPCRIGANLQFWATATHRMPPSQMMASEGVCHCMAEMGGAMRPRPRHA
jgi:hypothetical protein